MIKNIMAFEYANRIQEGEKSKKNETESPLSKTEKFFLLKVLSCLDDVEKEISYDEIINQKIFSKARTTELLNSLYKRQILTVFDSSPSLNGEIKQTFKFSSELLNYIRNHPTPNWMSNTLSKLLKAMDQENKNGFRKFQKPNISTTLLIVTLVLHMDESGLILNLSQSKIMRWCSTSEPQTKLLLKSLIKTRHLLLVLTGSTDRALLGKQSSIFWIQTYEPFHMAYRIPRKLPYENIFTDEVKKIYEHAESVTTEYINTLRQREYNYKIIAEHKSLIIIKILRQGLFGDVTVEKNSIDETIFNRILSAYRDQLNGLFNSKNLPSDIKEQFVTITILNCIFIALKISCIPDINKDVKILKIYNNLSSFSIAQ